MANVNLKGSQSNGNRVACWFLYSLTQFDPRNICRTDIWPYKSSPYKHLTMQQTNILPNKHFSIQAFYKAWYGKTNIRPYKHLVTQNLIRHWHCCASKNMYHLDGSVGECVWENCSLSNPISPRVSELSYPYSTRILLDNNYIYFILAYSSITITSISYSHTLW